MVCDSDMTALCACKYALYNCGRGETFGLRISKMNLYVTTLVFNYNGVVEGTASSVEYLHTVWVDDLRIFVA